MLAVPVPRRLKQGEEDVVVHVENARHVHYRRLCLSPGHEGFVFPGQKTFEYGFGGKANISPSPFVVERPEVTPFGFCAVRKCNLTVAIGGWYGHARSS